MLNLKKLLTVTALTAALAMPWAALAQEQSPEPAPTAENAQTQQDQAAPSYAAGTYTAKAKGYGGYVVVTLTIDDNGVITDVKLAGDSETPYVGGYALEEMPEWILAAQSAEVDAYSGATFTRNAVVEATQAALDEAAQAPSAIGEYAAGTYTAKAKGYGGYVVVTLTIDDNGVITDVKLAGDSETPYVGGYALEEMPEWILAAQSAEVDAYSGATFTRNAVVEATQAALDEAAGK